MLREHPGLVSQGFEPQGRFGIGFFSVFMWGERVKVVTRRPEDGSDITRVLEFRNGLSARPILRPADAGERLMESGTVVTVWLEKRATEPGGFLGPGPIESRHSFFPSVRSSRDKEWVLKDLCAWLCPAIDVNLIAEQDGKREIAVTASDWKTMGAADLLRRLLLHRGDVDTVCASEAFSVIASNLRDIRDVSGALIGRGAFKRFFHHFVVPEKGQAKRAGKARGGVLPEALRRCFAVVRRRRLTMVAVIHGIVRFPVGSNKIRNERIGAGGVIRWIQQSEDVFVFPDAPSSRCLPRSSR